MCGIFALIQPPEKSVDVRDIKRACSLMQHRGPDQSGYALLNNQTVGFGHNRLSIQDLAAPPQPLVDQSTGMTIILNGEVSVRICWKNDFLLTQNRCMITLKWGAV
jgi:asparagine synthase (glutamine-hydrolysing)